MKAFVLVAVVASLALLGNVVETEAGGVTVQLHGSTGQSQHSQHSQHWHHQGYWPHRHPQYVYVPQPRAFVYYAPEAPAYTADPRWQWDGYRWWFWDGYRWIAY